MPALPKRPDGVEYIEIQLTNAKKRYYFDYYPILESNKIIYLETVTQLSGSLALALSGRQFINDTARADAYIVLVNKGSELINRLPLSNLRTLRTHFPIINKIIDWQKSYIEFSSTSNIVTTESIIFAAYYESTEQKEELPDNIALNVELVDLPIKNVNQTRFYFSEVLKLKNKKIRFIDYLAQVDSPNNYDSVGNIYQKAYLTLRDKNGKEIVSSLYLNFINYYSASSPNYINFNDSVIDFDKSFVDVVNTTSLVLNTAFVFNFHYLDDVTPVVEKQRERIKKGNKMTVRDYNRPRQYKNR